MGKEMNVERALELTTLLDDIIHEVMLFKKAKILEIMDKEHWDSEFIDIARLLESYRKRMTGDLE